MLFHVLTALQDRICSNQDDAKEKSQQVALMRDIFKQAGKTIAWLGGPNDYDNSSVAGGVNFFNRITFATFDAMLQKHATTQSKDPPSKDPPSKDPPSKDPPSKDPPSKDPRKARGTLAASFAAGYKKGLSRSKPSLPSDSGTPVADWRIKFVPALGDSMRISDLLKKGWFVSALPLS